MYELIAAERHVMRSHAEHGNEIKLRVLKCSLCRAWTRSVLHSIPTPERRDEQ